MSEEIMALQQVIAAQKAIIERQAQLADKYKWQVRDTCTRAEQAEADRDRYAGLLCLAQDQHAKLTAQIAAMQAEVGRLKADWGRLIHKDEAAAVCRSGVECCFEYGDTVRCGPCGIDLAKLAGVEPDMTKPQLPEVSRLKRQLAAMQAAIEQAAEEMEINGLDLDTLAPFLPKQKAGD